MTAMSVRRTAIVTGGSRGLGRAIVRGLADRGWAVVTDARNATALAVAVDGASQVVAIPGDLTDADHRRALVDAAVELGGSVDLLVNNAGGLGPSPLPLLADLPLEALTDLVAINVIAPLGLIQQALPHLADGAAVVNVTSDAAVEAYPGWGAYGATKATLEHIGRVLAAERPELRLLSVDPGDLRTQMHQDAFPGEDISDRAEPEAVVPAFLAVLDGSPPSGRYRLADVAVAS
ncbi:MAG: SDR family NAD(P)-dependent oxidoreductase [Ilumatobacteraceae bacterium]